jgi:pyrimidodiazepine synthase
MLIRTICQIQIGLSKPTRRFAQLSSAKMSSLIALTTDSPKPAAPKPGQLRLYGHRFCPYVYRVRLVLAAKKIPHEVLNIHLQKKPIWLAEKNPNTKVPIIEKDGNILYESAIVSDYLDETYPGVKLLSTDPLEKAKGRILVENTGKLNGSLVAAVKNPEPSAHDAIYKEILYYENELAARGTDYFNGQNPGMTDYMLWPSFEWLPLLPEWHDNVGAKFDKLPHISKWNEKMRANPVVQECTTGLSLLSQYFKGHIAGDADPNVGL